MRGEVKLDLAILVYIYLFLTYNCLVLFFNQVDTVLPLTSS